MPTEKPFQPPLRKPVPEYQTPDPTVTFFSEPVDNTTAAYQQNQPMQRGRLYSTIQGADPNVIAAYPNLYFLKETKRGDSDRYVNWFWTTVPEAEDTYNAEIDYVSDFVAAPRFTRVYTIQRDAYEAFPAVVEGSPLTGIIGIEVVSGGANYQSGDTIEIDSLTGTGAAAELVVDPNGIITNVIVTSEGSGYTTAPSVEVISATGAGANLVALMQPQTAVLITQRKSEFPEGNVLRNEFVRVDRIYETLPGPFITTYRVDEDGATITVQRRHQYQTVIDAISPKETLTGVAPNQTWTRITSEPVNESYFVGWEVHESRAIQGNFIESDKLDEDGLPILVQKQMVSEAVFAAISPREFLTPAPPATSGVWTKITSEAISDLVVWKIVESRALPGNPIPEFTIDKYGNTVDTVRTLKYDNAITPGETIQTVSGDRVWTRTSTKPASVGDLVSWEVVEALDLTIAKVVPSVIFDAKGEEDIKTIQLQETTSIAPSQTESGGVIHTTEYEAETDLVSLKVSDALQWLDEAFYSIEIPNLIPEWARPQIPTEVESHIVSGTASFPTLGVGEFAASEKQLTKLLYERRSTHIPSVSFPITATNTQTSEKYGGAILTETITLDDDPLTADSGLDIVSSETTTLAVYTGGPPNGLFMKTTLANLSPPWPILDSTHVDETYGLVIDITKQVVAAGTTGGVSGGVYTEVKSIDQWRSISIASKLDTSSLPADVQWYSGQLHSFPPVLDVPSTIIEYAEATCGCQEKFAAVLQANLTQYRGQVNTRITEQFYNGAPPNDIMVTQFFPESHTFGFAFAATCGCGSDSTSRITAIAPQFHIPQCLHALVNLNVGVSFTWSFAATTPADIPHGTYIMLAPHVERWRFGVFRRVLTEVLVP